MKNIAVVGTGYVGLVTGACFAELGHRVRCIDTDESKVAGLQEGVVPIYEPDLEPIVHRNMEAGRFSVTTSFAEGLAGADFVFLTVGTPTTDDGQIDLSYFHSAYEMIAANLDGARPVIVNKSTVPPGTTDMMHSVLSALCGGTPSLPIVSNPEFLRESHAVSDFMHPTRVVIGARDAEAASAVAELHKALDAPVLMTDPTSAEMIKYASNAFLAMKISFINEIASICDGLGVDVTAVARGTGMDPRIGKGFLRAGIGYGGSCLPKDMAVLTSFARSRGSESRLLNAVVDVNAELPGRLVAKLRNALGTLEGSTVGVIGLTFKPETDDLRRSPALEIVRMLRLEGTHIRACDPQAYRNMSLLPTGVEYATDAYEMAQDCDAVVLATEWSQFKEIDLGRLKNAMRGDVLADGRNVIDPGAATEAGLRYLGMGRGGYGVAESTDAAPAPAQRD